MSLPYIKCPKCNERSSPSNYWTCPSCGYSESKESVLLEENKDYEEQRNKNWDNRDEELRKWIGEQQNLCKKIIKDCLPNQKVEVSFKEPIEGEWGYTLYYENDLIWANKNTQKALSLLTQGKISEALGISDYGLTEYTNEPTKINISPHTLQTKHSTNTRYGSRGAGFLPTTTHESSHASYLVTHDPRFQPWINEGHDDKWREIAIKFHDKMLIKYGKEIEERFKKLAEIEKKEK